jgi:hypothetical protein
MKLKNLFSHATTRRTQRKAIKSAVPINCFRAVKWLSNPVTVFVASLRSLRETGFRTLLIPLILHIMLLSPAYGADNAPQLSDFARMMPLTLSGTGALHELPLPAEVYTGSRRSDLGDLAVFNGAGEIVPFTLLQPPPAGTAVEGQRLPLFPLSGGTSLQQGNLNMQVRTDEHGAIVNLISTPARTAMAAVTTYIVDASGLDRTVNGFDFELQSGGNQYIGSVRVAISDDLQHWQEHACGALATLAAASQQLNRSRIEFPAVKSRYFRLTLCPERGIPVITSVSARLESPLASPGRATARYFITPVKDHAGDYLVQTVGRMPVDRLRLIFEEVNSLAGVTFFSRTDNKSPWIERGSGTFYRLRRDSSVVESASLDIAPTPDREWLIRVRLPGNALGDRLPMFEAGWQPQRLIFAARGEPPFRLAFGSARIGEENMQDDSIASGLAIWEKQQIKPLQAFAGASAESGGKKALRTAIPATTWRKLLLWSALLCGVLLLVRMAWKLSKEMGLDDSQKKAAENERHVVEKGGEKGDRHD